MLEDNISLWKNHHIELLINMAVDLHIPCPYALLIKHWWLQIPAVTMGLQLMITLDKLTSAIFLHRNSFSPAASHLSVLMHII